MHRKDRLSRNLRSTTVHPLHLWLVCVRSTVITWMPVYGPCYGWRVRYGAVGPGLGSTLAVVFLIARASNTTSSKPVARMQAVLAANCRRRLRTFRATPVTRAGPRDSGRRGAVPLRSSHAAAGSADPLGERGLLLDQIQAVLTSGRHDASPVLLAPDVPFDG